jgi:DNA-binding transcriptional LysR family regulator
MNLTHVLAFHRVASAGSFVAAARLAGVSQPTLSAQVRALEATAGQSLFARTGRRIHLTPEGDKLLQSTTRLAAAIGEVEQVVSKASATERGALRVSADSALHAIPILAEMKRARPGFRFSLAIANSAAVLREVGDGAADVGITARRPDDGRLQSVKLREDRLVLLVARADRWAGRKQVALAELAGRDLVSREQGSMTRDVLEERLRQARVAPGQVLDVETREGVMEAVAAGFGIGVVFLSESGTDPRLVKIAIRGADLSVAEHVVTRRDRHAVPLVSHFLETAQRVARARRWIAGTAKSV